MVKFFELYCNESRRNCGDSSSPEASVATLHQHVLDRILKDLSIRICSSHYRNIQREVHINSLSSAAYLIF
jgi:hypothetical protein